MCAPTPLWSDRLLIGWPDIDRDHQELFALAFRIQQAERGAASVAVVSEALCQMADYSMGHFGREENLMRVTRYPNCIEHVVEHYKFLRTLTTLINDYEKGRSDILPDCRSFLIEWFTDHISVSDMAFGAFLKDCPSAPIVSWPPLLAVNARA